MAGLERHWAAIRNVSLPGARLAFRLGQIQVGWVPRRDAGWLCAHGCTADADGICLSHAAAWPELARGLAERGAFAWRGEAFDVRATPDGPALATLDRGAVPWFGVAAQGVHVNGLVRRADGLYLWVARRAADRQMDPGKLDHLFAGGIAAGATIAETLAKEGMEEAGLPPGITGQATFAGLVDYVTERPEGLRRDRLHCFDLWLPEEIRPQPSDGEVADYALWPMDRVERTLRETDHFKFNVALVLIALLERCKAETPPAAGGRGSAG